MQFVQGRAPNYTLPYSPHQLVCYIYQTTLVNLVDDPSEVSNVISKQSQPLIKRPSKRPLFVGLAAPHLPIFANMDIYAS